MEILVRAPCSRGKSPLEEKLCEIFHLHKDTYAQSFLSVNWTHKHLALLIQALEYTFFTVWCLHSLAFKLHYLVRNVINHSKYSRYARLWVDRANANQVIFIYSKTMNPSWQLAHWWSEPKFTSKPSESYQSSVRISPYDRAITQLISMKLEMN